MELLMLTICVIAAWSMATLVNSLPHLGQLLVPSPWLLGGIALIVTTWLMRE